MKLVRILIVVLYKDLDCESLDLSALNILYFEPDIKEVRSIETNIKRVTNDFKKLAKNKKKQLESLARVSKDVDRNSINNVITSMNNSENILTMEQSNLTVRLNNTLYGCI